jgi:hypothetical protein
LKAIHPFIMRNWRRATKGRFGPVKNAPSDFSNAARRSATSAIGGLDVLAGTQKFPRANGKNTRKSF